MLNYDLMFFKENDQRQKKSTEVSSHCYYRSFFARVALLCQSTSFKPFFFCTRILEVFASTKLTWEKLFVMASSSCTPSHSPVHPLKHSLTAAQKAAEKLRDALEAHGTVFEAESYEKTTHSIAVSGLQTILLCLRVMGLKQFENTLYEHVVLVVLKERMITPIERLGKLLLSDICCQEEEATTKIKSLFGYLKRQIGAIATEQSVPIYPNKTVEFVTKALLDTGVEFERFYQLNVKGLYEDKSLRVKCTECTDSAIENFTECFPLWTRTRKEEGVHVLEWVHYRQRMKIKHNFRFGVDVYNTLSTTAEGLPMGPLKEEAYAWLRRATLHLFALGHKENRELVNHLHRGGYFGHLLKTNDVSFASEDIHEVTREGSVMTNNIDKLTARMKGLSGKKKKEAEEVLLVAYAKLFSCNDKYAHFTRSEEKQPLTPPTPAPSTPPTFVDLTTDDENFAVPTVKKRQKRKRKRKRERQQKHEQKHDKKQKIVAIAVL